MRWLLIVALATPPWAALRRYLKKGRRGAATLAVGTWFALFALALGVLETRWPGLCGRFFPGAQAYADGMLAWVHTGVGCEGTPSCFIPQHLAHLTAFLLLTLTTGGVGGLALATVLFGWMGAYTGGLALLSQTPWALVAGWHPWALLRVLGFLLLGVAFSEPLLAGGLSSLKRNQRWWLAGLALCVADVLLKWACAEAWREGVLLSLLR
ncbi:MAG: hypothetical protein ACK42L_10785 [Thermoanaerobaculum sp.]